jgi:hypothetical protein
VPPTPYLARCGPGWWCGNLAAGVPGRRGSYRTRKANCLRILTPQAPGQFYPYWTQARVNGVCVWEFGQMTNGNSFGRVKQYGEPTDALGLLEVASPIMRNPSC